VAVKRLRRWAGGGALAALLLTGCPFHETGLVRPTDEGTVLETPTGDQFRVVTAGQAAPLAALDGHTTEVWGTRISRRVHVTDWKVLEGLHGLPAWVGELDQRGIMIGVQDRNSGAYYLVDPDSAETLKPYVGKTVLLEGYVEGAHRVRVLYFRVLED
jgi:hypothetical protein